MTITLNELHDLTVPVAEDFNFNFRALKTAVEDIQVLAATMVPTPSGSIVSFAGAAAPAGWLICDGTAVSRATFAALFAAIGTTYGAGDGSSTFNVPTLKGRVLVGLDVAQTEFNTIGKIGGEKTVTLTIPEMPPHSHGVSDPGHIHPMPRAVATLTPGSGAHNLAGTGEVEAAVTGIAVTGIEINGTGGGGAHNNLAPYAVFHMIIKT